MDNELSVAPSAADTIALLQSQARGKYATDQALSNVTKQGFLPYITLHGASSTAVKRDKFPMGHFALVKSKVNNDIGDSFVGFLLAWRPKAMQYAPEVLSFFDSTSAEFKNIEATAEEKDSQKGFGVEFLVWLPEHKELATFFLGNKTGRNEAPNLVTCIESGVRQCRISSVYIEDKKKKYGWHGPKMLPYDLDITVFPSTEVLTSELERFNNPPTSSKAPAEKDDEAESRG